jgi:hypothetical protein
VAGLWILAEKRSSISQSIKVRLCSTPVDSTWLGILARALALPATLAALIFINLISSREANHGPAIILKLCQKLLLLATRKPRNLEI